MCCVKYIFEFVEFEFVDICTSTAFSGIFLQKVQHRSSIALSSADNRYMWLHQRKRGPAYHVIPTRACVGNSVHSTIQQERPFLCEEVELTPVVNECVLFLILLWLWSTCLGPHPGGLTRRLVRAEVVHGSYFCRSSGSSFRPIFSSPLRAPC